MHSAAEIADDRAPASRRSSEFVNMEAQTMVPARTLAESQSYWSQAYEAYAVVRDTVTSTASWSWSAAYGKWEQVRTTVENRKKRKKSVRDAFADVSRSRSTRASRPWPWSPT
jgi:hypothetical protein